MHSPGTYIRKTMLLVIVGEIGHEYEEFQEGAFQEEDEPDLDLFRHGHENAFMLYPSLSGWTRRLS